MVDFEAFRDVLKEVDYEGWAIVEQDMYPAPFDKPFPIAKRTRRLPPPDRNRLAGELIRAHEIDVGRSPSQCEQQKQRRGRKSTLPTRAGAAHAPISMSRTRVM